MMTAGLFSRWICQLACRAADTFSRAAAFSSVKPRTRRAGAARRAIFDAMGEAQMCVARDRSPARCRSRSSRVGSTKHFRPGVGGGGFGPQSRSCRPSSSSPETKRAGTSARPRASDENLREFARGANAGGEHFGRGTRRRIRRRECFSFSFSAAISRCMRLERIALAGERCRRRRRSNFRGP